MMSLPTPSSPPPRPLSSHWRASRFPQQCWTDKKSHSEAWKWRRGTFTFVLYHIWDKSDLLEKSRRADFYWRSWNRLQISDDPGVHTCGRYSGIGVILESSLVILETPSVTKHQAVPGCSDVSLCLTPCYGQSDHCHGFINQNSKNHNHTYFF